jgi:hypothetical protein
MKNFRLLLAVINFSIVPFRVLLAVAKNNTIKHTNKPLHTNCKLQLWEDFSAKKDSGIFHAMHKQWIVFSVSSGKMNV